MFTTEAGSFASRPSGRSGCVRYSTSVMITPSTESPRNSRRSLVGNPPFSYANDRWVSASTTNSPSSSTPSAALMTSGSGVLFPVPEPVATAGSDPDDLAAPVLPAGSTDLMGRRHRATRPVRTGDQGRGTGLPLRTARTGVATRHLPLRDGHD